MSMFTSISEYLDLILYFIDIFFAEKAEPWITKSTVV